jgi:hypothetical protein
VIFLVAYWWLWLAIAATCAAVALGSLWVAIGYWRGTPRWLAWVLILSLGIGAVSLIPLALILCRSFFRWVTA